MKTNHNTFRNCPFFGQRHGVYALLAGLVAATLPAQAAEQYFAGDGSALTASKYTTTGGSPTTGPFASPFVANNIIGFGVVNGTGTGGSVTVGGFDSLQNFTLTAASGTISNASNGVVNISVAAGMTLDFGTQAFTTSGTAGYIYNGNTTGVLALAGGAYGGGFTLNSGTVILRGTNALGGAATNTLTINGGIIAGSATRDLTGKYAGGITVGGDFQLGILIANSPASNGTALIASDTYNLTLSNNIALGTATTRTITLGNRGTQTLSGVISGASGLTFGAVAGAGSTVASNGVVAITGTANTFTGAINLNGPEVTFAGDGSLGNTANTLNIEGGRFTVTATSTITAARGIQVGSTVGTSISAKGGSTVVTYNGVIANIGTETGTFAKQGSGTLQLGGVSSYSGDTSINNGTLQLAVGSNRLPTGTAINVGQAASANVGIFDLNGQSQQIAGLNSTSGTNASTTAKNTVTSTSASTLTLGGGGTYAYGDGTAANSGVITGSLSVFKSGGGTQTFGDANTYTGSTTISAGTLVAGTSTSGAAVQALGGTSGVFVNGGGTLQMGAANQFNATTPAPVTLAGTGSLNATFSVNGNSQGSTTANGVGALTLTSASANDVLDFNGKAGVLTFANLTTNGATLTINNYSGNNGAAGGPDQLIFNQDETGNLGNIVFTGYGSSVEQLVSGTAGTSSAFYEVFPSTAAVPEPGSILGGLLTVALLGWRRSKVTA